MQSIRWSSKNLHKKRGDEVKLVPSSNGYIHSFIHHLNTKQIEVSVFNIKQLFTYSLNKVSQKHDLNDGYAVPPNSPTIFFDLFGVESSHTFTE